MKKVLFHCPFASSVPTMSSTMSSTDWRHRQRSWKVMSLLLTCCGSIGPTCCKNQCLAPGPAHPTEYRTRMVWQQFSVAIQIDASTDAIQITRWAIWDKIEDLQKNIKSD